MVRLDGKEVLRLAAIFAVAFGIWLVWLWRPERQVRLHQRALFSAVEGKKVEKLRELIAADYADEWGFDRERGIEAAVQVFTHFIICELRDEPAGSALVDVENGVAQWQGRVVARGSGSPVAEYVKQQLEPLSEPFEFTWKKQSWRPWDWQLTKAAHPKLKIPKSGFSF